MANPAEDFCLKFYGLEGVTIAERRKNFYNLLHKNASLKNNPQILDSLCTALEPQTYLESLFKVELLIFFRRSHELLQLLKEGNDVFVSKICKQVWFFQESFNNVPPEEIVNEILPCFSFCVRMKVLRKLSRYSTKFDEVFEAVASRYGIFIAQQFITGCSPAKIRESLQVKPLRLTSTQLRILYEKDPELIDFYFTVTKDSVGRSSYKSFFKYIFLKDRVLYDCLKKKFNDVCVTLGRRASKKFAVVKKDEIINTPYRFEYLDMRAVVRKLGKESLKIFYSWLPESPPDIHSVSWLFKNFPQRYHYSLFVKSFQTHYNIQYVHHPKLINEALLKLIPDNLERAILAKVKVDQGDDEFIIYLTTNESIPLLKEKINFTSDIYERGQLIKCLIETCRINNDINALHTVMKYFCFRHKNDEFSVHMEFINNIEYLIGFKEFTAEMWDTLNELLAFHLLKYNDDPSTYQKIQTQPLMSLNLGTSSHQKLSYLEFLFKKGEPIDNLILDYYTSGSGFPSWTKYDKDFSKYFLNCIIQNLSKENLNETDAVDFNSRLIQEINYWNKAHKDDQFSFYEFPKLAQTFDFLIKNPHLSSYEYLKKNLKKKIFTFDNNQYKDEYLQIYWEHFDDYYNSNDLDWFLKYDPETCAKNFDKVFKSLVSKDTDSFKKLKIWYKIKKYNQMNEKSFELCLSKIYDDSCLENKSNLVACLSVLMNPVDYAIFADKFKPANKKLDLKNETEVKLYKLQCAIAQQFRNTKTYKVLDSLLNYCAGDYFKYALRSLNSIMYRTPENLLPHYLNYLSTKAVSVRKHALFFTCELCTSSTIESMIKILNTQENVLSLQKQIFSSTFQYFLKNPSDSGFELVKLNMLFIKKTDEESLNTMLQYVRKIPLKYQASYIQYCWEFLEKTVDIWKKLKPMKESLLLSMNVDIIRQISLEFVMKILQDHFMSKEKSFSTYIYGFASLFVSLRDEKDQILQQIFTNVNQCENQEQVTAFIDHWYDSIMDKSSFNLKSFEPFVTFYESKVTMVENFKDFIRVFFLKLKLESSESLSPDEMVTKIIDFFQNIVTDCGPFVVRLFAPELKSNLKYFESYKAKRLDYYEKMIKNHPVPAMAILLLEVLSVPKSWEISEKRTLKRIIEEIRKIEDVGVQINLQLKFKNYNKTHFDESNL
ncbi:uncharacterized protein LOC123005488 [Tribolium madens]|uniref:uncharacterized protein LOC123005488 n=1 Tax=Tribolium madens TaxID=41895 RepID=UPI001CF72E45|nr:uncharacterized protein LOC123005488 [Tribolium madens]